MATPPTPPPTPPPPPMPLTPPPSPPPVRSLIDNNQKTLKDLIEEEHRHFNDWIEDTSHFWNFGPNYGNHISTLLEYDEISQY